MKKNIPENHGLSSKSLLEFFDQIERLNLEVNNFILLLNGKVTAQFSRKPYRQDNPQLLFSLSKSFTSIAVGIAWDNGLIDLNDKVISFFHDKLPDRISSNLAKMTIHHLLSMNTGHHDNIYGKVAAEEDWVKTFLSLDVEHEPGSHYRYNTHATYMLSAIIEKVTGQHLVDFLMTRLFEPLGIPKPSWETCPMGITAGGMGLSISTENVAKFGQMLLNRGMFDGKRIVSEQYIEFATTEQSDNRKDADRIDSAQGYGYQFHLCRRGCYRGDGAFGQLCFVAPKENIVIAANSSFEDMDQLQTLLDLIYEYIIEPLNQDISMSLDDHYLLQQRLAIMTYSVPSFQPVPDDVPRINNCFYKMDENPHHLQKLNLSLKGELLELQFLYENSKDRCLLFDFTKPVYTRDLFIKDLSLHHQEIVTYAFWQDQYTLKLTLLYIETPYVVTYTLIFKDQSIELQFSMNVSLSIKDYIVTGSTLYI